MTRQQVLDLYFMEARAKVIDLAAPTSLGGFSSEIRNNNISCDASAARYWLSVENSRFLYRLNATGNWCSCMFSPANFNGTGATAKGEERPVGLE